jgi:hypothetical protein
MSALPPKADISSVWKLMALGRCTSLWGGGLLRADLCDRIVTPLPCLAQQWAATRIGTRTFGPGTTALPDAPRATGG